MKYHIDTIPVWDAFKAGGECPLCDLRLQNEAMYLDSFLGASVMEPNVRVEVNEKGFCGRHFAQMLTVKNRLGLSLMTHTHLKKQIERFEQVAAALTAAPPKRLLGPRKDGDAVRHAQSLTHQDERCVLCERLRNTMARYTYTTLHLFQNDAEFRKLFESSAGLCLPHFGELAEMVLAEMPNTERDAFLTTLITLQRHNLQRLEQELEWFTLKFDYRNHDKPWGNSKDAPDRAIEKLTGKQHGE